MSNNRDRNLVSGESHEIEYIHQQFPNKSHQEVENALREAKAQLGGSKIVTASWRFCAKKLK